jgi:outer membrane protein OmpA-like peptidoglycan-associated protein/tetratricopeptide (TPR) repeat protein
LLPANGSGFASFLERKSNTMKKFIISCFLVSLASLLNSQEKRWIRKAAIAVDRCNYDEALSYYDKVLQKDTGSYYANAGKGVVLSEYMDKPAAAIPYLQRALRKSPDKTKLKLTYDLGKSYHKIGNYNRALYFYGKAQALNTEDSPDFDVYLNKRVEDCKYALAHQESGPPHLQSVTNVGRPINSEFPEYSPVFVNNELIFTSQRKDSKRERKNGMDGRYFESMYLCSYKDQSFSVPHRHTFPDKGGNSKFLRHNESVLSASADGKKLFIYRNAKIYEADLDSPGKEAGKMDKRINFSHLQSHACLSPDGQTLFFASESDKGNGAIDIYMAKRESGGNWSVPELLPFNSEYNDDSPYMSNDGTLYFASNGLPGYGGYDIYRTRYENGKWKTPENLGQPVNSPGDDIYFALLPGSSYGYYSSSRPGGMGDMDIYQVHYIPVSTPECVPLENEILAISAMKDTSTPSKYFISMKLPERYPESDLNIYNWKVNNAEVSQSKAFEYDFNSPGVYTISAKTVVYCDSCADRAAICTETLLVIDDDNNILAAVSQPENTVAIQPVKEKQKGNSSMNNKGRNGQELSEEELRSLGWKNDPLRFGYNEAGIQPGLKEQIDNNIDVLKKNRNLRVQINGHTDSRGSAAYNVRLSERRANSVKQYLMNNGIAGNRISVHPYGESMLLNRCADGVECSEEEHAVNRRVEFKVYHSMQPADKAIVDKE